MDGPENKILTTLLDRIYATLVHGPCLNCRVHRSRQRVDLFDITALQHLSVKEIVPHIIADSRSVEIRGKVPVYRGPEDEEDMTEKDRAARLSYEAQARLLTRLRDIAEDAERGRIYLPAELLAKHGLAQVSPQDIVKAPGVEKVCAEIGAMARERFTEASRAMPSSERRNMRPALLMRGVYEPYLDRIEATGFRVDGPRIKFGKFKKLSMVLSALLRTF